jgi:hypothetical protein
MDEHHSCTVVDRCGGCGGRFPVLLFSLQHTEH